MKEHSKREFTVYEADEDAEYDDLCDRSIG